VMPEQQGVDLDELLSDEHAGGDDLDAVDEQPIARLPGGPVWRVGADRRWRPARPADHCLVEFALEGEITEHLGYDRHDAAGRDGRQRDGDVLRLSALGVDREEPCDQTSGDRHGGVEQIAAR